MTERQHGESELATLVIIRHKLCLKYDSEKERIEHTAWINKCRNKNGILKAVT